MYFNLNNRNKPPNPPPTPVRPIIPVPTFPIFGSWVSFDNIPDDAYIQVYYLQAYLSTLTDIVKKYIPNANHIFDVQAFHTGMGFVVLGNPNPIEFALEYVASDFSINAIIPDVTQSKPPSIKDIKWVNGSVIIGTSDMDYWNRSTYMCTIRKSHLLKIKDWLLNSFIPNNKIYTFFKISKSVDTILTNPTVRSSVCDDLCTSMFKFIQSLKIPINYVTQPTVNTAAIISNEVSQVDMTKQENVTAVVNYYKNLNQQTSKLFKDISEVISDITTKKSITTLMKDISAAYSIYKSTFDGSNTTYYYGYDSNNKLQYWEIKPGSKINMDMVPYPIKNNVAVKNLNNITYKNDTRVDFKNTIPAMVFPTCPTCPTSPSPKKCNNIIFYITIGLLIILCLFMYFVYTKNLKKLKRK
jgi:hypothetical protein